MPSLFLAAAALILAAIVPLYVGHQERVVETVVADLLAASLMIWGAAKGRVGTALLGAGALFLLIALELATQPVQLGVPLASVWPLRLALLLLVALAWAILMGPPLWARRALVAAGVPLGVMLAWSALPTLLTLNSAAPVLPPTFPSYWLAVDSRGTLYATSADGDAIMVFDASGAPLGTLWPGAAPEAGASGPRLRPIGYPTPVLAVPTPVSPGFGPTIFNFCGIATGPGDRLLVVDSIKQDLISFDRSGNVAARRPLPDGFEGSRGCIAVDDSYIYLASRFGVISILDREAKVLREVKLSYQPFAMAADRKGNLLVMGFKLVNRIEASTGNVQTLPLPQPPGQVQSGYQTMLVSNNGEIIATDLVGRQLVRIDLEGARLLGTIGGPGALPGRFQSMGGLAQDAQGRIYVADWQPGAIHRFTPDGNFDAVLWAPWRRPSPTSGEEGE